ncbi:MAG: bifunctional precorrin-2 dehydrogenase/sirohydrochlorin ferrochelatase [Proteobacteria bacterium]|nr:bifunctional precorrin-2 dehydrogenase/sirohydrochlorin ferrochelatase [Pseudomonadota bacterium]MBU1058661.1 bifunctional precorrin-2 dehydrogenase/sirohydrochlorin ferrochelatase [Pseudomonadota bacterium]
MTHYPVNLVIKDQLCLVIGGGSVATRKVTSLLACGAAVRVISPQAKKRICELAESGVLEWQQRKYRHGDLQGARLVFAATDSHDIQDLIIAEANAAGILVNVVTRPEACTFQVPAALRQGELLITVSTGGGSPALATRIKQELQPVYGPEYGRLVALMSELRRQVVPSSGLQTEHKRIFERVLEADTFTHIRKQEWGELEALLRTILPSTLNISSLVECARKEVS